MAYVIGPVKGFIHSESCLLSWDSRWTNFGPSLLSISKFDERSAFLYVLHNAEDFQIYFCTEMHCKRSVLCLSVFETQPLWAC